MAARMGSTPKRNTGAELRTSSSAASSVPAGQKRLVWRISASAPLGEWVDPSKPVAAPTRPEVPEVSTGGFLSSSFDLLRGTDVHELPGDTVPAELLDEFFPELSHKDDKSE